VDLRMRASTSGEGRGAHPRKFTKMVRGENGQEKGMTGLQSKSKITGRVPSEVLLVIGTFREATM